MQDTPRATQALGNRKRFLLLLVYALILSPWFLVGTFRALESNANSPLDWVDDRFAPRQDYDRFSRRFGAADVVVISWPGCQIDDPRIDQFVHRLRSAKGFHDKGEWLFHHVTSGREALASLVNAPVSMPPEEATQRLQGWLIGPDRKTTCVVIGFAEAGLQRRERLVPLIQAAAHHDCGAAHEDQHLAGPIIDGYAVDQASQATMRRFAPLASLLAFCLCLLCIDSLVAACLVFGLSLACQAIALSVVHYGGGSMTALLMVLPPLVQLLAIAGGIHFVNYYFDCAAVTTATIDATTRAFQIAWLPCVLSAATTAVGLGSLMVSGLVAIREFGFYALIAIVVTVALLLSFLPGALSWFSPPLPKLRATSSHGGAWLALTNGLQRRGVWVCTAAGVLMVGLGFGVSRLEASVGIETLFNKDSRLLNDYTWIERHVGSLVPIEMVAEFPADAPLSISQKFATLQQVKRILQDTPEVDSVVSPLDFVLASQHNTQGESLQAMERSIPILESLNYLNISSDGIESWRTTAYTSALGNHDYVRILHDLDAKLSRTTKPQRDAFGMTVSTSGLMPLVHEIQQQLLNDLFTSFLTAFVLIAAIMTIVQAGVLTGLLAMIPNVFPALTLFGFLGWTGQTLDIGSIMTASVAMGIAVDDTLHFLTYFGRELAAGKSRYDAVLSAYRHCGRAVIQTTLICGGGFAIFALSDFVPTARFAWMMILLLLAALVGDLLVLPALLLGSAGKQFERGNRPGTVLQQETRPTSGGELPTRPDRLREDAAALSETQATGAELFETMFDQ